MKKIVWIILTLLLVIFLFLVYQGLFAKANIILTQEGGYTLVGIDHKGPYYTIGDAFEKLKKDVEQLGIKEANYAGMYFDNPDEVVEDSLRSFAAIRVNSDEDRLKLMALPGYKTHLIERGDALVCDMKTNGPIAMIIAVYKAYPAFKTYFTSHTEYTGKVGYTYELYTNDQTRFVFQLKP